MPVGAPAFGPATPRIFGVAPRGDRIAGMMRLFLLSIVLVSALPAQRANDEAAVKGVVPVVRSSNSVSSLPPLQPLHSVSNGLDTRSCAPLVG